MEHWKHTSQKIDLSKHNWLERKLLEHSDPVNLFLHIIAIIIGVYGLWINVIEYVIIAIIIALLGHVYIWGISRKSKGKN